MSWTPEHAERHLLSLELFGMRFGLDRVRRLLVALGSPQERFASIHVVGTNGKSSTTRLTASLLTGHGRRVGAYLSPHLAGFEERIQVDGQPVSRADFAAALERAARAAERVDRTNPPDDRVTQFELLTAAALDELARSEVDVAVVEAGLGGRWDATNVLPSAVQVLTSVGLDHTDVLGNSLEEIAREKLAVVRDGGTLVVGPLPPEVLAEAAATAREHRARLVRVAPAGTFPARNLAVASAAAEAFLGHGLRAEVVARVAAEIVPGRLEVTGGDPLTVLDGAHNPAGAAALAEALAERWPGRRVSAAVSVLDGKDAEGILGALLPACEHVVFCTAANPRSRAAAELAELAGRLTGRSYEVQPDPARALARARELAAPDGLALATGSLHLVADLVRPADRRAVSAL